MPHSNLIKCSNLQILPFFPSLMHSSHNKPPNVYNYTSATCTACQFSLFQIKKLKPLQITGLSTYVPIFNLYIRLLITSNIILINIMAYHVLIPLLKPLWSFQVQLFFATIFPLPTKSFLPVIHDAISNLHSIINL